MPRLTPGAKTQAAVQKVVDSDKGTQEQPSVPKHTSEDYVADTEVKEGPPWELTEKELAKLPAAERKEERAVSKARSARKSPASARKAKDPDEFVFEPLSEQDDYLILTLYGPAGTRKTTSMCRMTAVRDTGRLLVIAAESGLKRQALAAHGVDVDRVVFWPRRGQRITYEGLEQLFYRLLEDLEKDPTSWVGIGWDSLTEIIQMLVDNAAEQDIVRMAEIASKAGQTLDVRKVYEREGTDYQKATGQFRQLLRKYRTLPCHQVFVCLEEDRKETVETDDGRKQKVGVIGPALTPMVRIDVEQHSDVILRVSVAEIVGVGPVGIGRSSPAEDLRAKDRYGVLPIQMIDPGFERIWGYITGEIKEETDGQQAAATEAATAVESPGEAEKRKEEAREAAKVKRQAARAARPKAGSPTEKVTAESGTPDNPPM